MHKYKVTVNILDDKQTIIKTDRYKTEANNKAECTSDVYWKYSYIPRQRLQIKVVKDK